MTQLSTATSVLIHGNASTTVSRFRTAVFSNLALQTSNQLGDYTRPSLKAPARLLQLHPLDGSATVAREKALAVPDWFSLRTSRSTRCSSFWTYFLATVP